MLSRRVFWNYNHSADSDAIGHADDMGLKQLPRNSAEYLFDVVMRRHENRSTVMTSNTTLGAFWPYNAICWRKSQGFTACKAILY